MQISNAQFERARANLTRFVIHKAAKLSRELSFSYEDAEDAPSSDEAVAAAFENSVKTHAAFPVWNGACDRTIYTNREGNLAFRFWHDMLHATQRKCMTLDDEIALGKVHIAAVQAEFGRNSVEAPMIAADTIGQSIYEHERGEFSADQLAFVRAALGVE